MTETRDSTWAFHPLTERIRPSVTLPPGELLHHMHQDLLEYSDAQLDDDIAALVAYHLPDGP